MWFMALPALVVALIGGAVAAQRQLVYLAHATDRSRWARPPAGYRRLDVRSGGTDSFAWYHPPAPGGRVIVWFHGNAASIAATPAFHAPLLAEGHGALLVEWRGYGGNPGEPEEAGIVADARAALALLRGLGHDRFVLAGHSLGTGVACALSRDPGVEGLALFAPFTSLPDVVHAALPWIDAHALMEERFDSRAALAARPDLPVLVVHGTEDDVVPFALGQALARSTPGARLVALPGVGHAPFTPAAYVALRRFLSDLLP
jgi:pimeloyl-ACP methyl ester carboxylesterase